MAGPFEAVLYIHSPMRRDLHEMAGHAHHMDEGAPTEETKHHLSELQQRYTLWSRIVDIHEESEEQFLFPALDAAVAGTSAAYHEAHLQVSQARADVAAALAEGDSHQLHGLIHQLERELYAQLDQEEQTLLPLADQHIPPADQTAIAGKMSAHVPADFFQEAAAWMLRYQSQEEREGFLRMFQEGAPPEAFGAIKAIAQQLLSESEWAQLTQRLPALTT